MDVQVDPVSPVQLLPEQVVIATTRSNDRAADTIVQFGEKNARIVSMWALWMVNGIFHFVEI